MSVSLRFRLECQIDHSDSNPVRDKCAIPSSLFSCGVTEDIVGNYRNFVNIFV